MATGRGWSRKVCRHTLACFAKTACVGSSCLHEWARRLTGESEYELLFLGVFVVILFLQFLDSSAKTLFLECMQNLDGSGVRWKEFICWNIEVAFG
jgi:hypothetical protein